MARRKAPGQGRTPKGSRDSKYITDKVSRIQKRLHRRATAAQRRRAAIAARYGLPGDDPTDGYPRPRPTKHKGK